MTAIRRVQAFEEYDLHWIEEPLGRVGPARATPTCGAKTTSLIAYGEKEWDLAGFERVLDTGTVDVIGVDPGRAEGITGFKKVTERVEQPRRQSNAHAWSSRHLLRGQPGHQLRHRRRPSSSSSSRCATRCSTTW